MSRNDDPVRTEGLVRWCAGEDVTGIPMVHLLIPKFVGDRLRSLARAPKVPFQHLVEGILVTWLCGADQRPAELDELARQVRDRLGCGPAQRRMP